MESEAPLTTVLPHAIPRTARPPQLSGLLATVDAGPQVPHLADGHAYKSAQWSRDGTCILTNSGHQRGRLDTPHDLLTVEPQPPLQPYASLKLAEPVYASVPYPFFNLAEPSTALVLSSSKDHPVQLHNALAYASGVVATYPLVSEKEDCITPSSLEFTADGSHFVAGSDRYLSVFDVSRNGDPAVEMHRTIPSRKAMKRVGGVGISGVISSLSISCDRLLAAGTFNRAVGLYASEGRGEAVALFKLDERYAAGGQRLHGTGITKLSWSPCGRYLYLAERRTDLLFAYDIRVTGTLLGTLVGRAGDTNQRLDFDVVATEHGHGHEIWAGGTDGAVRVWCNPQQHTGDVEADGQYTAHSDPIVSSAVHPSGMVLATCAAPVRSYPTARQPRHAPDEDSGSSRSPNFTHSSPSVGSLHESLHATAPDLKLWSII